MGLTEPTNPLAVNYKSNTLEPNGHQNDLISTRNDPSVTDVAVLTIGKYILSIHSLQQVFYAAQADRVSRLLTVRHLPSYRTLAFFLVFSLLVDNLPETDTQDMVLLTTLHLHLDMAADQIS